MDIDKSTLIRWTRQSDGTYIREGTAPSTPSMVRLFVFDDQETDPDIACLGLKLWTKEELIDLVERQIANESYKAWRYEIRPDGSAARVVTPIVDIPQERFCKNERCKKGINGTRGIVKSARAKYCSPSCRVAVSRETSMSKRDPLEKRTRKPRRDRKYSSHAERQREYQKRRQLKDAVTR